MTEARLRADWQRQSVLCAVVANTNPHRRRAAKPDDFNPYVDMRKRERVMVSIDVAMMMFCGAPPKPPPPPPAPSGVS
jgi:hypothetical protein